MLTGGMNLGMSVSQLAARAQPAFMYIVLEYKQMSNFMSTSVGGFSAGKPLWWLVKPSAGL